LGFDYPIFYGWGIPADPSFLTPQTNHAAGVRHSGSHWDRGSIEHDEH